LFRIRCDDDRRVGDVGGASHASIIAREFALVVDAAERR